MDEYADEARARWGDTDAFRESHRRTSTYTKQDWQRLGEEAAGVDEEFAACLQEGLPAGSPRAMAAAEAHRQHIGTWFYPCSYEMQTGLADMYVADERFTDRYEAISPGLARYVRDAIWANAVAKAG